MSFTNTAILCIPYEFLPALATALLEASTKAAPGTPEQQWLAEQVKYLRADYDEEIKTRNLAANVPKSLKKK